MAKSIQVTRAQAESARLLVETADKWGQPVPPGVRALAKAATASPTRQKAAAEFYAEPLATHETRAVDQGTTSARARGQKKQLRNQGLLKELRTQAMARRLRTEELMKVELRNQDQELRAKLQEPAIDEARRALQDLYDVVFEAAKAQGASETMASGAANVAVASTAEEFLISQAKEQAPDRQ